jgi:hypothetical protein
MAKKNFKTTNPAMQFITQQEEAPAAPHTPAIQDPAKRGQSGSRINLVLDLADFADLQIIARIDGVSITEYINNLIETDKAARVGELEHAKEILRESK